MAVFILGATLFLLGFAVHVTLWRISRPRATAHALIVLFISTILCVSVTLGLAAYLRIAIGDWLPGTLSEWMQGTLMALAVAAAYVLSYPAIEAESPTLVMIDMVAKACSTGIARSDFYAQLPDAILVVPRIADLLDEGFATNVAGRYVLTAKGRRLANSFRSWRRLLGAGLGG